MAITFYDDILVPKVDFGNPTNDFKVSIVAGTTISASNYTLPLAVPNTNGKLLTTSSSGTLSWIGGVTTDYLSARSANLISNFNGLFGDNSNFSEFGFDPSIVKNSPASFKITGHAHDLATDEYIAVEPTERYELTTWARQSVVSGKYYMGIRCYDVDGNQIHSYNNNFQPGTLTQLTHELQAGDTFIVVSNNGLNSWYDGPNSYRRSFIFWNQTTNLGYVFPPETYSQAFYSNVYDSGQGFNSSGIANSGLHNDIDVIFLSEPWDGPYIPEGTRISNGNGYAGNLPASGIGGSDQFVYCMPSIKNDALGTTWAKHTGYIEGVVSAGGNNTGATTQVPNQHKFLIGTAKVKIGWHAHQNYVTSGNETSAFFTNLLFRRKKLYILLPDPTLPETGLDAGLIAGMTVNNTKFGYLSGLNSDVQTQITQTVYNTTSNSNTLSAHTTAITAIQNTLKDDTGGGGKGVYSDSGKATTSSHLSLTGSTARIQAGGNTGYVATETSPGVLTMTVQAGNSNNEIAVTAITIAGSSEVQNAITTFNQKAVFSHQADFNSTVDLNGNATGISTNQVTEGTNLYYTDARARAAITAGANITITAGEIASSTNTADIQTYLSGGSATTIETSGNVTVGGNLIVSGTQTQLNTTTLEVEDINIVVGKLATTSALTDGAGLTFGAWSSGTIPTLTWDHANARFAMNRTLYNSYIKVGTLEFADEDNTIYMSGLDNLSIMAGGADIAEFNDTRMQISGDIIVTGTVDGIDIATDVAANTAKTGITSSQASAITANTAKTTITSGQASAITANTAKVSNVSTALTVTQQNMQLAIGSDGNSIVLPAATSLLYGVMSPSQAAAITLSTAFQSAVNLNTAKISFPGFGTTSTTALVGDTALLALGTSSTTALAGDTALLALGTSSTTALAGDTTTISSAQASAITANTAKTSYTDASAVAANTNKISYSTAASDAVALNTAKTGITSGQASAITANTAKVSNIVQTTITGNAGTATQLAQTVTIGGEDFDGDQSIDLPGVNIAGTQNTSGNAATATTLATARNIGGVSFNGSAAITLPGVNAAGTQDTSGNAATATKIASITNTDIVQLAGAQTLSGVKTFSSSIVSPGITSASNGNIVIDPHGTGSISLVADEIKFITGTGGFHGTVVKLFESSLLDGSYFYLAAPATMDANWGLTVPDEDGTQNQVMKTNGSGTLSWTSVLDGTNDTLSGTTNVKPIGGIDGKIAFYESTVTNYVLLQAHNDLASNYTLRLPTADGSANQTLKTDGSGNLGWSTPSSGGGAVDLPLMTLGGRVQHSTSYDNRMIICGGTYGPTYYIWSSPFGITTSGGGTVDTTTFTLSMTYQHYGAIRVPTAGKIKVDFIAKPLNSGGYSKPYVLQIWEFTPAIGTYTGATCTLRAKVDMTSSSSSMLAAEATMTTTSDIAAGKYVFVTMGMDAQTLTSTAYQYMNINLSILA